MDVANRFHTPLTYGLVRLEATALLVVTVVCAALHVHELRWWPFVTAFIAIDAIGYFPGAVAHRRAGGARISPIYHHLYNVTHSWLTAGVVVGLWALALGGRLEWAMAAFPIHLLGDRGLFGNVYKPVELPFEPRPVDPRVVLAVGDAQAPSRRAQEVA
jgi:hypothetical protein